MKQTKSAELAEERARLAERLKTAPADEVIKIQAEIGLAALEAQVEMLRLLEINVRNS